MNLKIKNDSFEFNIEIEYFDNELKNIFNNNIFKPFLSQYFNNFIDTLKISNEKLNLKYFKIINLEFEKNFKNRYLISKNEISNEYFIIFSYNDLNLNNYIKHNKYGVLIIKNKEYHDKIDKIIEKNKKLTINEIKLKYENKLKELNDLKENEKKMKNNYNNLNPEETSYRLNLIKNEFNNLRDNIKNLDYTIEINNKIYLQENTGYIEKFINEEKKKIRESINNKKIELENLSKLNKNIKLEQSENQKKIIYLNKNLINIKQNLKQTNKLLESKFKEKVYLKGLIKDMVCNNCNSLKNIVLSDCNHLFKTCNNCLTNINFLKDKSCCNKDNKGFYLINF